MVRVTMSPKVHAPNPTFGSFWKRQLLVMVISGKNEIKEERVVSVNPLVSIVLWAVSGVFLTAVGQPRLSNRLTSFSSPQQMIGRKVVQSTVSVSASMSPLFGCLLRWSQSRRAARPPIADSRRFCGRRQICRSFLRPRAHQTHSCDPHRRR